ncbi:cadherin-like domain-containing protein [Bosea sp. NPDC003192]|uniref:cadherin-like domain-containing protein n=1 Tax=Bosea sp. NPDC003192 TaxID=3390551 RepID=UPI003CFF00B3
MIDVKAARRTEDAPQNPTQSYERSGQDTPLSLRGPALLVALMAAVVAYVQGIVDPGKAATPQPQPEQPKPPAADGKVSKAADEEPAAKAVAGVDEMPDETGALGEAKEKAVGTGGPGPTVPGLPDFLGIDSPMFEFEQLPLPPLRSARIPDGFGEDASNDNWSSLRVPSGSGGLFEPGLPTLAGAFPSPITGPDGGGPDIRPPGPVDPGPELPPRNRAPRLVGPVRLVDIGPCQTTLLTMALLLAGASDADADPLSIRQIVVSHGTLQMAEGGWLYTPAKGYYGPVTVSYVVSDGKVGVVQHARFDVVEILELTGTEGSDSLTGTDCRDLIKGLGGDDLIEGRGAADIILAGAGNDTVYAGAGNDLVHGGAGDDILYGGAGNDTLYGDAGNDHLYGEAGNDILDGGDGDDVIAGGAGDDLILGGAGDDLLDGGDGNDKIDGGEGANTILTGSGDNDVVGGDGGNVVIAQAGIDNVRLGAGGDIVRVGGNNDYVDAGAGDNIIFGEDGDDTLISGAGNDMLDGGDGADLMMAGAGRDYLRGGGGDDTLDAGDGDDKVEAGDGNDVARAGAGNDRVYGEGGDDVILGEAGDDCLVGGAGNDVLLGGDGDDEVQGSSGDDHLAGGSGKDKVRGGDGNDKVIVDADCQDDDYDGGAGTDTLDLSGLTRGAFIDLVEGKLASPEAGHDEIACFEVVIGGAGDDTFIIGTQAPASVAGGRGDDTFRFELDGRDAVEDAQEMIHKILDLEVGDRILISQYTLRRDDDRDEDDDREGEDGFGRTYGDENGDSRPFRFRIEKIGDQETTFIDVDIENEGERGLSIEISGAHQFQYYS